MKLLVHAEGGHGTLPTLRLGFTMVQNSSIAVVNMLGIRTEHGSLIRSGGQLRVLECVPIQSRLTCATSILFCASQRDSICKVPVVLHWKTKMANFFVCL